MSENPYLGEIFDIGVLFVHGIGQSKEGDTVARFGESLRLAVAALAKPGSGATVPSEVKIGAAWLAFPGTGNPCRAQVEIENVQGWGRGAPSSMRSRWLLAEAWWAAQFPPPSFSDVALWATGALPGTLLSHVDRRLRRAGYAIAEGWKAASPGRRILGISRWLVEWAYLLAALAALPLLIAAVLLLILAGLLPPPLNRLASALQRVLSSTVGDSYAFKQNRIKEAAIRRNVLERLEWLAARCRSVVVVAHSQGAAIAHDVLRQPLTAPCDVFVSCGSGLAKLSEIERDERDTGQARPKLWVAALGAILTSASLLALILHPWGTSTVLGINIPGAFAGLAIFYTLAFVALFELSTEVFKNTVRPATNYQLPLPWNAYAGLVVALPGLVLLAVHHYVNPNVAVPVGALALGLTVGLLTLHGGYRTWQRARGRFQGPMAQWQRDEEDYRKYYELTNRQQMRWLDLYTRHDPVPNGPLMDFFRPPAQDLSAQSGASALESNEVYNLGSALLDHTTYFSAQDDFVQRIARLLLRKAGIAMHPVDGVRASARRHWRVGVLRWGRRMILVAAALAAAGVMLSAGVLTGNTPPISLSPAPEGWMDIAVERLDAWAGNALYVGFAVWLAGTALILAAWSWWNAHELKLFHANGDFALCPTQMACTVAIPVTWLLLALLWTLGWIWALAWVLVVAAAIALMLTSKRAVDAWRMRSRSGERASLNELDAEALKLRLNRALKHENWHEVVETGRKLAGRGERIAAEALHTALKHRYAPAARELARYYESRGYAAKGERRKHYLRAAFIAYQKGAELEDGWCARAAGYRMNERYTLGKAPADRAAALKCFKRAVELKDAPSCHTVALLLEAPGDAAERRRFLEIGVERSDGLSACWLARDLRDEAAGQSPVKARATRELSANHFRKALEWGWVDAAADAGEMFLEVGDVATARRAHTLGARLRSARAALGLGLLEERHAQDLEAATVAYQWALQLKPGEPASALYGLGRVLRAKGRNLAARARYEEALNAAGDSADSARAGVELAELLQQAGDAKTAKAVLLAACKLQSYLAIDKYVMLIQETDDWKAAQAIPAGWGEAMNAESRAALAKMLVYQDREKALAWAATALEHWSLEPDDAAAVLGLFHGDDDSALYAAVAGRERYYRESVAKTLDTSSPYKATRLREARGEASEEAGEKPPHVEETQAPGPGKKTEA